MKKLIVLSSTVASLINPKIAFAQSVITISPPPEGYNDLGKFVNNVFTLAFGIGILVVLVMLIWGSFEWISSGGDKEHVASARGRIINALIGLAVLAIAFALARVGAQFIGIDIFNIKIPGPTSSP